MGSIIHNNGKIEEGVTYIIKADWLKYRNALGALCNKQIPSKLKINKYPLN